MSVDRSDASKDRAESQDNSVERIADPDNYNLRRRLKQLHDAKARVRETKAKALEAVERRDDFRAPTRDRFVAETVVDYLSELEPVLDQNDSLESFLNEDVPYGSGDTMTIKEYLTSRGTYEEEDGRAPVPYQVSMEVWRRANKYFEKIAGAEFEATEPDPSRNPVDPSGRFHDE